MSRTAPSDDEGDSSGTFNSLVDALKSFDPPPQPLHSTWEISFAELMRRRYRVPKMAAKALGVLDRFGALRLTPSSVTFDRDEVEWDRITVVRTRQLAEALTHNAIDREVARIGAKLPPLPGRAWAVDQASALLQELADKAIGRSKSDLLDRSAVVEVQHHGRFGRSQHISAGLVVVAMLGAFPEVNELIISSACSRGAELQT